LEPNLTPEWLSKPWMYTKPKNIELLTKWRETWVTYITTYAQQHNIHIININDLKRETPFNKMDNESLEDIINAVVNQGYGKWLDKNQKNLRIYWRSFEKWAEQLVQTARKKEKLVIIGIKDIVELEPALSNMPEKDIEIILNIMIQQNIARWIDKKKKIIKIN
jgi:hypothetical protein